MSPPSPRPLGPDAEGRWVRRWTSHAWTRTVDAWVAARLSCHGRRIVGEPVTYRARLWSVVRCYPTSKGLVWLKENNPAQRFEPGLIATMASLDRYAVVEPIAVDPARGRMLTAHQGATLDHADVADQPTRCAVVAALARLQCAVLGRIARVEHPGMIELEPRAAGDRVRGIGRAWAGLAGGHPLRIDAGVRARVDAAADVLDRCTSGMGGAVPLDLECNDVYAANVFSGRTTGALRPRFFDFGNAIWGHPFVTLHGFLESVEEWTRAPLTRADREQLYAVYLRVWSARLGADPEAMRAELTASRILVTVHRLVAWIRLIPYADPIELRARAEIPLTWLARIATLADHADLDDPDDIGPTRTRQSGSSYR